MPRHIKPDLLESCPKTFQLISGISLADFEKSRLFFLGFFHFEHFLFFSSRLLRKIRSLWVPCCWGQGHTSIFIFFCIIYMLEAPVIKTQSNCSLLSVRSGSQWIGVPGEIRGYEMAHKHYGKLPWAALFQPTIQLAREGFPIPEIQGRYIAYINTNQTKALRYNPPPLPHQPLSKMSHNYEEHKINMNNMCCSSCFFPPLCMCPFRDLYTDKNGNLMKTGDIVKFEKLADTLEKIADQGAEAFYTGSIAEDLIRDIQEAGIVKPFSSSFFLFQPFSISLPKCRKLQIIIQLGAQITTATTHSHRCELLGPVRSLEYGERRFILFRSLCFNVFAQEELSQRRTWCRTESR